MKILSYSILFFSLVISGCASISEKPEPETTALQARGQLQQFAKIIEHINQATTTEEAVSSERTERLNQILTRLDGPLQTLENSSDDSEKVRGMLAAADEFSGNQKSLFSGLFDLFSQLMAPRSR